MHGGILWSNVGRGGEVREGVGSRGVLLRVPGVLYRVQSVHYEIRKDMKRLLTKWIEVRV